jgi:hypothetical protein
VVHFQSSEDAGRSFRAVSIFRGPEGRSWRLISRSEMSPLSWIAKPAVHQWSRIWKKNPNLENILRNPIAARAHFAIWNCRNAGRRGGMEGGKLAVDSWQLTVDSGQLRYDWQCVFERSTGRASWRPARRVARLPFDEQVNKLGCQWSVVSCQKDAWQGSVVDDWRLNTDNSQQVGKPAPRAGDCQTMSK